MKTYSKIYILLYLIIFIVSCKRGMPPGPVKKPVIPVDKQLLAGWWVPADKNSSKSIIYFGADNFFYCDTTGKSIPFAGNWNVGSSDTVYYNNSLSAVKFTVIVSKLTKDSLVFHLAGTNSAQRFLKTDRPAITSPAITTIAGIGTCGYTGDNGSAKAAKICSPAGILVDKTGNIYFCDRSNNVIRKISAVDGKITTIAGNNKRDSAPIVNNMPATSASLLGPVFLIMDATGNIYFSVGIFGNCVYKISAADGTLTRIAGSGVQDFWGDGGPATSAGINEPQGLALDAAGNLYIADLGNHRIRKVSATTGIISTVAGSGSYNYSGDGGPATAAGMSILDLAVDATGNIYFSDFSNDRIRKIASSTGIITTVAGTGLRGNSGDGGMAVNAKLYLPFGVKLASNGDVYFADAANNSIRKITLATGIITTVAGNGYAGYTGDGLHATAYSLIFPYGIAIDSKNNIYVGDNGNARIRKVAAQ